MLPKCRPHGSGAGYSLQQHNGRDSFIASKGVAADARGGGGGAAAAAAAMAAGRSVSAGVGSQGEASGSECGSALHSARCRGSGEHSTCVEGGSSKGRGSRGGRIKHKSAPGKASGAGRRGKVAAAPEATGGSGRGADRGRPTAGKGKGKRRTKKVTGLLGVPINWEVEDCDYDDSDDGDYLPCGPASVPVRGSGLHEAFGGGGGVGGKRGLRRLGGRGGKSGGAREEGLITRLSREVMLSGVVRWVHVVERRVCRPCSVACV